MIYLGLVVLGACSMGLLLKYAESQGLHRYHVTAINYLTASMLALGLTIRADLLPKIRMVSWEGLLERIRAITWEGGTLPQENSILWAILIGMLTGFFFLNAFVYFQRSIFESGIALSGMFSRLGVLIPMTVSIIIWKEIPSWIQNIGIVLAISAIVLVNLETGKQKNLKLHSSLLWLFVFAGAGIFCNKLFQKYALLEHRSLFLLFTFSTAFILALRFVIREKQAIRRSDTVVGVLVGISNLTSNFFLVMALSQIKAAIVFPISSAGTIITMALGGFILFKEKLSPKDVLAIFMTIIAIILINL